MIPSQRTPIQRPDCPSCPGPQGPPGNNGKDGQSFIDWFAEHEGDQNGDGKVDENDVRIAYSGKVEYERLAAVLLEIFAGDERFRGPPGNSVTIDSLPPVRILLEGPGQPVTIEAPLGELLPIPPQHVQILDQGGNVLQEQRKALGSPIRFQLVEKTGGAGQQANSSPKN